MDSADGKAVLAKQRAITTIGQTNQEQIERREAEERKTKVTTDKENRERIERKKKVINTRIYIMNILYINVKN